MGRKKKNIDFTVNKRVVNLRKNRKLNQTEFAKIIGIKQSTLSDIERCKISLTLDLAKKIAENFKCNLDWILTGNNGVSIDQEGNINYSIKPDEDSKGYNHYIMETKNLDEEMNRYIRSKINMIKHEQIDLISKISRMIFDPDKENCFVFNESEEKFLEQLETLSNEPDYFHFPIEEKINLMFTLLNMEDKFYYRIFMLLDYYNRECK